MSDQWNAQLYDGAHEFVSEYGKAALEILAPAKGERILDLGCGTGDLANKLSALGVDIVGIDHSEHMIANAKAKYPGVCFSVKDILDLGYENEFDAVFSNAVLHWIKSPEEALKEIYKSLCLGGKFIAEFGGEGNVKKITDSIIREKEKLGYKFVKEDFPWYFPSIGEYTSLMEQVGFHVTLAEHIDRPTKLEGKRGLRNWLEMFTANFFSEVNDTDKHVIIKNIEQSLANELFYEDHWIADYKRIRVKAKKKQLICSYSINK